VSSIQGVDFLIVCEREVRATGWGEKGGEPRAQRTEMALIFPRLCS